MRSSTSTIGPTSTWRPVSSCTSRATATSSVSPISTAPPGRLHSPLSGWFPRRTSSTRLPSTTTAPTPTTGRSGNSLDTFFPLAAGPHGHPNAAAALGTPPSRRELTLTPRRGFTVRGEVRHPSAAAALGTPVAAGAALELLSHNLHNNSFFSLAVELGIEHLLPRTEIELPGRDQQRHLVAHDRALQVRVRVVFAGLMMTVIETGWCE